jgi:acyl-CoA synthetase (AMP-forming)/AMP-acid ligase II
VEWLEIYAATAKAGLVCVPVNFRLTVPEIRYIVENCEARALIVQDALADRVDALQDVFSDGTIIHFGSSPCPAGWRDYEGLIAAAAAGEPGVAVAGADPWMLIRSHRGGAMLSMLTEIELGLGRHDSALLVMPMCHANSLYFFGAFSYCGAAVSVYSRQSFDPEHLLATLSAGGATFTSLVPTHYVMMLALSDAVRGRYDMDAVTKLMISSAPARRDTKLAIMEYFRNSGLYELYGSTEAGWVTMLHPEEQLTKLGSVGRECVGSGPVRLLDANGQEVAHGGVGELYSRNAYTFDGYWKLPDKTAEAFRGDYCTVGDMARRDGDGYLYLVDRKSNMIISGGENVYPSEVESLIATHPAIRDVAVIGLEDETWGERVHAVVVPHDGQTIDEASLIEWCQGKIAGYKRPRSVSVIAEADMPRTATGKIQHRILKTRLSGQGAR